VAAAGRLGLAGGGARIARVGQGGAEPLGPELRVGLREGRRGPALPEDAEPLLAEPVTLCPAEERAQELGLLPRVHVAPVLGRAPAVEPAAPAGGEVAGLLVERGRTFPVLEHARLGTGGDPLPEPLDAGRDEGGLDELAGQLVELLEEQPLPGVREDPVRVPEDPVDPAEVVAEPRGPAAGPGRLRVLQRPQEVRLVVPRAEAERRQHVLAILLERPEETQLEGFRRMGIEIQHRQEHVERLVGARRQAPEGARQVPARGPPAMLVEAVGRDGGLQELDDVVDVRALAEQRERVRVPLLGDRVRAPAVVEVAELVERPRVAPEKELAGLEERGVGGAHDAQLGHGLPVLRLGVEPEPEVHLELVAYVRQRLAEGVGVAALDRLADLLPDGRRDERRQGLGPAHGAMGAPDGRGRHPLADVLPVAPDALEPGGHLELEDGFDVDPDQLVTRLGVALGGEPRALELEQDHLVDRERDLGGHPAPRRADERGERGPNGAHVGALLAAPGDLADDQGPDRVAEGLPHRAGRAHEGVGPPEQLVRALEEAQRLREVALPGGPPPEDVEGEAERREVAAPGAVLDLEGPGGIGLQGLDGALVLLAMLGGEIKETGLDEGDEPGKRLDDLVGRPKRPLDGLVHARSLQPSSKLSLKV
jgi:hypothetical protein